MPGEGRLPRGKAARPRAQPSPAGLSRERIVAAALAIIDAEGVEGFSMRGLAQALGVYPTAIYWHVPNRNALLAEVVAHALAGIVPPDDAGDWDLWLKELFRRYRGAVRRHPHLAALMGAQLVSNAGVSPAFVENVLAVLSLAGFTDQALVRAYNTVIALMVGFVTIEFAAAPVEDATAWAASLKRAIADVDPDRHPLLARNLPRLANHAFILRWQNGADVPLDDSFEMYVDAAVRGLKQLAPAERPAKGEPCRS
jgi:TetR/AcrR family transcriptional regulator, tetracycline repressor protein